MSSIAIKAENLSKAYQLGEIGTGTISRDMERWLAKIRGKEDPFLKIGETNDRSTKGDSDIVWSLKDINFEIQQGDAVGIIGRNGAGKSTLLKILSKVTSPTTGKISGKGRVASLLEVGTGFHPELTGRENIYLNGAILGMRRAEIKRQFDAIVDFAGVERYIDTPVKRYSSGMYVRLAFAVAAHLESEILIVDEVLAVGDAEFQRKCLGKMGDVSKGEGRTVLFVSHNMGSIKQLCNKGIFLQNGLIEYMGTEEASISAYLKSNNAATGINPKSFSGNLNSKIQFDKVSINGVNNHEASFDPASDLNIQVAGICLEDVVKFRASLNVFCDGHLLFTLHDSQYQVDLKKGTFSSHFKIPGNVLRPKEYSISIGGHNGDHLSAGYDWIYTPDVYTFSIQERWSLENDFNAKGFLNIPFHGNRNAHEIRQ